jgi:hypothetical protein
VNIRRGDIDGRSWSLKPASYSRSVSSHVRLVPLNKPDIRYLRPIEYPQAFGVLHTTLNVIGAEPKVRDNLLVATILSCPIPVCWNKSTFGALGNPSSALDLGGCLLGMAFTTGFVRDPSNVPL